MKGLSRRTTDQVDKGNAEGLLAIAFLSEAATRNIAAVLEHPFESYLLQAPEMKVSMKRLRLQCHKFHQCLYDGEAMKGTTFVATAACTWLHEFGGICSNINGICDRTGKHRRLQGFRTTQTQYYSDAMAEDIADFAALTAAVL